MARTRHGASLMEQEGRGTWQRSSGLIFITGTMARRWWRCSTHTPGTRWAAAPPLADEVKANLVQALAARSGAHVLLAWVDDQPVGVATCFEGFSTFACRPLLNIHDLAVHPAHRGHGIGKALLAGVEQLARELDCCKLTLEVLEGNKVAQAAYKASGFEGYELNPQVGLALFWQKKL